MKRYVVKAMGLYIESIGESYVEFVKDLPKYGLTDNLRYARKEQEYLRNLMGIDSEVFVKVSIKKKNNVSIDGIADIENENEKYYIFENDNLQAVSRVEDTGNIELSFQQCYKMTKVYEVERVEKRLEEFGLRGYKLKEVIVQIKLEKIEDSPQIGE